MIRSMQSAREKAAERGLNFIYSTARDPENFSLYGFDYLFCLDWISATSLDGQLRRLARKMGRERARHWRVENRKVPRDVDADAVTSFVFASAAADRLGIRDGAIKAQIERAAARFTSRDYFWFDPLTETPPSDVPSVCECGAENLRGRKKCGDCKTLLQMMNRYEVYVVALIRSYQGERYKVKVGARYKDVLARLPDVHPYPEAHSDSMDDFLWAIYVASHVVYTLNHYNLYSLSPDLLPHEFSFLKQNVARVIEMDDYDAVGEMLDSLKSFGVGSRDPLMRRGMDYLVSRQNSDGSWGDTDAEDIYDRYHPTLTAVNGLREYGWRGQRLSFPKLKPLLERWAASGL
jgi:hypothetical protein